jgi:hypothetical protein
MMYLLNYLNIPPLFGKTLMGCNPLLHKPLPQKQGVRGNSLFPQRAGVSLSRNARPGPMTVSRFILRQPGAISDPFKC